MSRQYWDEIDAELDAAIDALNAEQPLLLEHDAEPLLRELVDTARVARQLRVPTEPDEDFGDRIVDERSRIMRVWLSMFLVAL